MNSLGRLPTVVCVSFLLHACGATPNESPTTEAWNDRNAPARFGAGSDMRYDNLPTSASIEAPWSDDYWATRFGGISYRWQTTGRDMNYRQYLYQIPTPAALSGWGSATLNLLSPAEKYDLIKGKLDLPTVRRERNRTLASVDGGDVPGWFGICHGWAPASFMEPQALRTVRQTLPDGRTVDFYPSDIHALVSRFYADYHSAGHTRMLGSRCEQDTNGRSNDVACRDTNPGAFHLAVIHQIADLQAPFVAELDDGVQIWNHPVYGYSVNYANLRTFNPRNDRPLARFRAPGTAYLVDVRMNLSYAVESRSSQSPSAPIRRASQLAYSLELDSYLRVIGGEWSSDTHPDFLWRIEARPKTTDVMQGIAYADLQALLEEAR